MLEFIAIVLLIPIIFLLFLALVGNPSGIWIFGPMGVQILFVVLAIIGIIGVFDMLQGVLIAGGITGTALLILPFLLS